MARFALAGGHVPSGVLSCGPGTGADLAPPHPHGWVIAIFRRVLVALGAVRFPDLVIGAMLAFVSAIRPWSVPAQIFQAIVQFVTVVMAAFHAFRTWADKCRENKYVNFGLYSAPKRYSEILLSNRAFKACYQDFRFRTPKGRASSRHEPTTYTAQSADVVKPIIRERAPLLCCHPTILAEE